MGLVDTVETASGLRRKVRVDSGKKGGIFRTEGGLDGGRRCADREPVSSWGRNRSGGKS